MKLSRFIVLLLALMIIVAPGAGCRPVAKFASKMFGAGKKVPLKGLKQVPKHADEAGRALPPWNEDKKKKR